MILAIIGGLAFLALGVSCIIECFDDEDGQHTCDADQYCGVCDDTRDHRI